MHVVFKPGPPRVIRGRAHARGGGRHIPGQPWASPSSERLRSPRRCPVFRVRAVASWPELGAGGLGLPPARWRVPAHRQGPASRLSPSDKKAEIDTLAAEYIASVRALSAEQRVAHLQRIQSAYSRCKEYSDDKVQLAMQTYEMVRLPAGGRAGGGVLHARSCVSSACSCARLGRSSVFSVFMYVLILFSVSFRKVPEWVVSCYLSSRGDTGLCPAVHVRSRGEALPSLRAAT